VKKPVFSFEAELLTDAPFEHIEGRILSMDSPAGFSCQTWLPMEREPGQVRLRWERRLAGTLEQGSLCIRQDEKGAHLHLEGRMKGWSGFLFFGAMRWRTDRLLDRFVEEL